MHHRADPAAPLARPSPAACREAVDVLVVGLDRRRAARGAGAGRARLREAVRHLGGRDGRRSRRQVRRRPLGTLPARRGRSADRRGRPGVGRADPGGSAAGGRRGRTPGRRPGRTDASSRSPSRWAAPSRSEAQAVAEGALLGSYRLRPDQLQVPDDGGPDRRRSPWCTRPRGKLGDVAGAAETVARAVADAREWVNIPANLLYPESFADQVRELVSRHPDRRRRPRREGAEPGAVTAVCWPSAAGRPGRRGWSG